MRDYGLMVLGSTGRQKFYDQIEKSYQLKREKIPEEPRHIPKPSMAYWTSAQGVPRGFIVRNLYSRLTLNLVENPNWTLVDYAIHAKKHGGAAEGRKLT